MRRDGGPGSILGGIKDAAPEPRPLLPAPTVRASSSDERLMSSTLYINCPPYIGTGCVCVQLHYLPLASLHLAISVSVGTRPRFANSILASFRTADSSIR